MGVIGNACVRLREAESGFDWNSGSNNCPIGSGPPSMGAQHFCATANQSSRL